MKFAVVSDSHGHLDQVVRLAERLITADIRHVIHLGDDYDDAVPLIQAGLEVRRVPGVFSPYYQDPSVANRQFVEWGGLKLLLTHSEAPHDLDRPEDEDPAELARRERPDLVLFGHTHIPTIEERDGRLWINPGHLKPEDKKGAPPSCAAVDTGSRPPRITILGLEDNQVRWEK